MAKDFSHRTKSTQRYAGTTAGFYNEFVHVSGAQNNYPVTPTAGYVLVRIIFGTSPASGSVTLKCGNDIITTISSANAIGDKSFPIYLYDQLFYSTDVTGDVTFVITKGINSPNA